MVTKGRARVQLPRSEYVLVWLGGMAGTLLRAALLEIAGKSTVAAQNQTLLLINLLGSFLLGLLLGLLTGAVSKAARSLRLFLGTGALGGFTTYSTFALLVAEGAVDAHITWVISYAAATLLGGLVAAACGYWFSAGIRSLVQAVRGGTG